MAIGGTSFPLTRILFGQVRLVVPAGDLLNNVNKRCYVVSQNEIAQNDVTANDVGQNDAQGFFVDTYYAWNSCYVIRPKDIAQNDGVSVRLDLG